MPQQSTEVRDPLLLLLVRLVLNQVSFFVSSPDGPCSGSSTICSAAFALSSSASSGIGSSTLSSSSGSSASFTYRSSTDASLAGSSAIIMLLLHRQVLFLPFCLLVLVLLLLLRMVLLLMLLLLMVLLLMLPLLVLSLVLVHSMSLWWYHPSTSAVAAAREAQGMLGRLSALPPVSEVVLIPLHCTPPPCWTAATVG